MVAALVGTLTSNPGSLSTGLDDRISHVLLGALFSGSVLCLVRSLPRRRPNPLAEAGIAVVASAVFLVATELLQNLVANREPEMEDALADGLGLLLAVLGLSTVFALRPEDADRVAAWYSGLAVVTAVVSIGATLAFRDRDIGETWPAVPGVETACIDRHVTGRAAIGAASIDPAPKTTGAAAGPVLAIDLATEPPRLDSALTTDPLIAIDGATQESGRGLRFDDPTDRAGSLGPMTELSTRLAAEQRFSVEIWFRPDDLPQRGPTRLLTLSDGLEPEDVDLHLGVHRRRLSVRIQTDCGPLWFLAGRLSTAATHAAVTYDRGLLRIHLDGRPVAQNELADADLSAWDRDHPLTIGNETTGDRAFRGLVAAIEIHDRALTPAQVAAAAADPERRAAIDDAGP